MRRKESIIRHLALVGRADWRQIANYIVASLTTVSTRLSKLKHSGLVHNMKWSDGSKVWVLTPEGYRRHDYYQLRDKSKKYKQRQKRSNVLAAFNHLKAGLSQTPYLAASSMSLCLPLSEGASKWQEQTIRQLKPRIHLNNKREHDSTI